MGQRLRHGLAFVGRTGRGPGIQADLRALPRRALQLDVALRARGRARGQVVGAEVQVGGVDEAGGDDVDANRHAGGIHFDDLPTNSTVQLFSVSGHLVREYSGLTGDHTWDGVKEGRPATGDIVTRASSGVNYTSPGYAG